MKTDRKQKPSLSTKMQPAQQRAAETYERILEVAAQTLADVGIERLSTNMVCERASLTPPALYRYFPNKYALLSELGQRLMQRQNERIERWISPGLFDGTVADLERALEGLILDTYAATEQAVGGVWIMRAMRAVPVLQDVRLTSHAKVTKMQTQLLSQVLPDAPRAELELTCRIAVELIYATVEMLFDERQDTAAVARTVASMIASQLEQLRSRNEAGTRKRSRKAPARA
ncbi:TetR/AcrR family transcriptional regulator [Paraburkholderia dinghuensis]|uniref:TetR/AcrR family transcriptional regulator n=1 Tax=Paraburkholderia dinghuensis TaxID=2305225 RepID=A0A3N6N759_9BURK|nr:TetR/AcrR family transcriptional regulator [Paraburkholderia dinghuensis]RQH03887.1 TetR/AcrR family transcriptional regulator [Paraburkholderia dinghuensis]